MQNSDLADRLRSFLFARLLPGFGQCLCQHQGLPPGNSGQDR
jgi:hypothetical protein